MEKNILVIIGSLKIGGAEKHLTFYLPKLVESGFKVTVACLSKDDELSHILKKNGVQVEFIYLPQFFFNLPRLFRAPIKLITDAFRLSKLIKQNNIVHFFLPYSYISGMFGCYLARFKGTTVMSRRSLNLYQNNYLFLKKLEIYLHKKVDMILANSEVLKKQLITEEEVPENKVQVIYNGVFKANVYEKQVAKKELNLENKLVFTIVANLIPYKGHKDLIQAFANIKDKIQQDWVLLCVGEDRGILEELKELCYKLNVHENIIWLGLVKDTKKLMQASDIGILASHEEGFSNAILEYMNYGIPVIATDVGGNKEAVGSCGIIVEKQNISEMGQAILELQNKTLCKSLGAKAKERLDNYFSIDFCVENYINFYNNFLAKEC